MNTFAVIRVAAASLAMSVLFGCASAPKEIEVAPGDEATPNAWIQLKPGEPPWRHVPFPGKQSTQYSYVHIDGRDAIAAKAESSASIFKRKMHVEPKDFQQISFSWKVPYLIGGADMTSRDKDDCPVRLLMAFDGDRSKFSAKNSMLSELARTLSGEELPYATLMYVWSEDLPVGTVIINPRTDRVRKLVVESGSQHLNQWLDYKRDIHADFVKAFGEPPGPMIGMGIMTDADNMQSHASAWYGPVRFLAGTGPVN